MTDLRNLVHHRITNHTAEKYAPKLTPDQRRKALGLVALGFPHRIVADHFNVGRRTISAMTSRSSAHYKGLRKEYDGLGERAFVEKYVQEDDIRRCNDLVQKRIDQMEDPGTRGPNPQANAKEGYHAGEDAMVGPCRVQVLFTTKEDREGWWWKLEGDDQLFGPLANTSAEAYRHACESGWTPM